jgi:hypothetical protein
VGGNCFDNHVKPTWDSAVEQGVEPLVVNAVRGAEGQVHRGATGARGAVVRSAYSGGKEEAVIILGIPNRRVSGAEYVVFAYPWLAHDPEMPGTGLVVHCTVI